MRRVGSWGFEGRAWLSQDLEEILRENGATMPPGAIAYPLSQHHLQVSV